MAIESLTDCGPSATMLTGAVVEDVIGNHYVQAEAGPVQVDNATAQALDAVKGLIGIQLIAAVSGVDLSSEDKQVLYTVPAGKKLIVTEFVIADPSDDISDGGYQIGYDDPPRNLYSVLEAAGPTLGHCTVHSLTFLAAGLSGAIGVASTVLGIAARTTPSNAGVTGLVLVFGYLY